MPSKKILLLNPPGDKLYFRDNYCSFSSKANYYWPPIDLLVLSGILWDAHQVSVLDANVEGLDSSQTIGRISKFGAEVVVMVTGTASFKGDMHLAREIKEKTGAILIASGGLLLFEAHRVMEKNPFLDCITYDFSDNRILKYIDGVPGPHPNLIYRDDKDKNRLVDGERKWEKTVRYPLPRHELFPIARYRIPNARSFPFTRVLSTLGCPHRCTFCVGCAMGYKTREIDNIIEELHYVVSLGIREINFSDFSFIAGKKRTMEICRRISKENFNITWIARVRADALDEELVEAMKKAGCHGLQIGVESGDDNILKKYDKGYTTDDIRKSFGLLKKYKIQSLGYFIIGLPGETAETVKKTVRLACELDCDYASFSLPTPDYGTPMREEAIQKKWYSPHAEDFDSSENAVFDTPTLSKDQALFLRNWAVRKFYLRPGYIFNRLRKLSSLNSLKTQVRDGIALLRKIR